MFTLSEENYLKTIYHLGLNSEIGVSTNEIAKKMQTKASSVTDMIKKLSDKNLVVYKKYKGVRITDFGRNTAANIVRKHRLWEVFLVEKLNFSWDEVHEVAEQLEHIKSPKLINELDALLGFPKQDPHGDPIPDAKGEITTKDLSISLSNTEEGNVYLISRLMSDDKEFFDFCGQHGLKYGNTVLVSKQFSKNKMTQILIKNNTILLNEDFTSIIYVNEQD